MNLPIYLIVLALAMVLLNYLNISVSYFKFGIGLMMFVGGLQMILTSMNLPSLSRQNDHQAILGDSEFRYPNTQNSLSFLTVFGKSNLDLRQVDISRGDVSLNLITYFGEIHIVVNPEMPLQLTIKNTLGKVIGPDGQNVKEIAKSYSPENVAARPTKVVLNIRSFSGSSYIIKGETLYKRK
jgi:hypothetical protein